MCHRVFELPGAATTAAIDACVRPHFRGGVSARESQHQRCFPSIFQKPDDGTMHRTEHNGVAFPTHNQRFAAENETYSYVFTQAVQTIFLE